MPGAGFGSAAILRYHRLSMGFYDRDYYRQQPARGGFGHFVAFSVTTWLIAINVAVFFADAALRRAEVAPDSMSMDEDGQQPLYVRAQQQTSPLTRWGEFST